MHGNRYEVTMGSMNASESGMFLELWERPSRELALWAFYSDVKQSIEFMAYKSDVPRDVEEWFQQEARRRLPPATDANPDDILPSVAS